MLSILNKRGRISHAMSNVSLTLHSSHQRASLWGSSEDTHSWQGKRYSVHACTSNSRCDVDDSRKTSASVIPSITGEIEASLMKKT